MDLFFFQDALIRLNLFYIRFANEVCKGPWAELD